MLLRRMTDHVRSQNWFAVLLDFLIVVLGVFFGFQLNNWNQAVKTDQAYAQARERVRTESEANLSALRLAVVRNQGNLPGVEQAIDILRDCRTGPDDKRVVITALNRIRGTQTIRLRHTALAAITQNETLLSKQPEDERERLNELRRSMMQAQDTLDWLESWPFETPIENLPAIGFGALDVAPSTNGLQERRLDLAVPLNEACKDAALLKHFYLWERVASFQILRAQQTEARLQEHLRVMGSDN